LEPEVHIIEKYFQEVLHCFTMTNIRCRNGKEIDLLAIDPIKNQRYHVEARVSTAFPLGMDATKTKSGRSHRNGLDFMIKEKFNHPCVVRKVEEIFGTDQYFRLLVIYSLRKGLNRNQFKIEAATKYNLLIEFIGNMIDELVGRAEFMGSRDDVLRVLELVYGEQMKASTRITRMVRDRCLELTGTER
jgi:hypothetical protein